jgi:hypothetical protein
VSLRLPRRGVTVLLGPGLARRRVMAALDEESGRCGSGHDAVGVVRLVAGPDDAVVDRLHALAAVGRDGAALVLVDGVTDGLTAGDRRAVLREVSALAAERAVLLHDDDPVAALAVADGALRVDRAGGLTYEPIDAVDYLAS